MTRGATGPGPTQCGRFQFLFSRSPLRFLSSALGCFAWVDGTSNRWCFPCETAEDAPLPLCAKSELGGVTALRDSDVMQQLGARQGTASRRSVSVRTAARTIVAPRNAPAAG